MAEGVLREVMLALPMAPEMELEASKTATAIAESIRMSPDRIDEVRMAVVEACINALEHSRASDGEIYVTFQVLGDKDAEKLRTVGVTNPRALIDAPDERKDAAKQAAFRLFDAFTGESA